MDSPRKHCSAFVVSATRLLLARVSAHYVVTSFKAMAGMESMLIGVLGMKIL